MPLAEGLIFLNEDFGFGLMSKLRLWSYSGAAFTRHTVSHIRLGAKSLQINKLDKMDLIARLIFQGKIRSLGQNLLQLLRRISDA